MSLPQLVGLKCSSCGDRINAVTEALFCSFCGNPVHHSCLRGEESGLQQGRCTRCGGDSAQALATEVRKQLGVPDPRPLASTLGTPRAADYSFAVALVWILRLLAVLCLVGTINQMVVINDTAAKMTKQLEELPPVRPDASPAAENLRPDISAPLLLTLLVGGGAAIVVLALAEMLKLLLAVVRNAGSQA